jgi:TolB protein
VPSSGGAPRQITSLGQDLSSPSWSPDGKEIVFLQVQGDRSKQIYVVDAAGGSPPRVLVDQGANAYPQFSPDGSKIAYYSVVPPTGSDIFIVPAAGGATSNLTHLSTDDYQPVWSPDGKKLAWSSRRDQQYKIVVGSVDGSQETVVSTGDGSDSQPAWGAPVK